MINGNGCDGRSCGHGFARVRDPAPNDWEPIGKGFAISGLGPGQWTVRLRKGDQVIAEKSVTLRGDETVPCNFGGP